MGRFIAKVCIDDDFAQQHIKELGSFWDSVTASADPESDIELMIKRFTFALFRVGAQTKDECVQALKRAWSVAFPEDDSITDIFSFADTEDESAALMTTIFRNYYGVNEYVRLATELNEVIPILKEKNALDVLIQQNYLFAIDGGCGFTTMLMSLGDFLHQMNVYPQEQFKDRLYYREFKCALESKNGFGSPDDVIDALSSERESYKYNIIGLDISQFLDGKNLDELREFIRRLNAYQSDYVFAFRIPFLEKKALDEISAIISDQMLLRVVQVPPLSDSVLMGAVWNCVTSKGFEFDDTIMETILRKFHQEKMDGRFYGFKTAAKISNELMLCKAADAALKEGTGDTPDRTVISADDLTKFIGEEKEKLTGYDALGELIGMQEITQRVKEIVAQVKVAIANEKLDRPCIHMRFTGAPGTGKTTVARIIGQILREEGILRKGGFFEYEARDLVAEYEGQTAVKAASICRDAYGSVLFIDEAYALDEGKTNGANFGKEAIATLVSEMENHRDDMLVVMAGYKDDMEQLMKVNQGLRSRMPYILDFPNYTREQLFDIFMLMVKKHFDFDEQLETHAHEYFLSLADSYLESKEFANARFVRNLYERTWSKAALRCTMAGHTNIVLTKQDFICASEEKEFNEKIETKKKLGFKNSL